MKHYTLNTSKSQDKLRFALRFLHPALRDDAHFQSLYIDNNSVFCYDYFILSLFVGIRLPKTVQFACIIPEVLSMDLNHCVSALEDKLIACLQENLRIPSVQGDAEPHAPYGAEVRRSLEHVLSAAEALGFRTENVDNHLGWCEYGEGDEMIAVLGHLDVVPAGDGWTVDPYGAEISDGKIWGRGATDDKGPTIASLFALAALRDSGLPISRRIRLLFGCNEETGSADVRYYLAKGGEIPVMGFTPDGEYPVINGEKGIVNVTFGTDYSQEGDLRLISIQGGTAPNVVPAHAIAKISCSPLTAARLCALKAKGIRFLPQTYGVLVEAEGVSAHGSTPGLGENAIGRLLLALDTLPFEGKLAELIHFLAATLGMETDGTAAGIALHDQVSGGLTLNLGTISADETHMSMQINYRYPVTFRYEDCGPVLNKTFTDAGFIIENEFHKPKLYVPGDSALVKTLLQVYREQTGLEGSAKCIGGGTYAKMLPNILAFGPIFPGDEVREHKPDEYISIENLMKNTQIYAHAMYAMAK